MTLLAFLILSAAFCFQTAAAFLVSRSSSSAPDTCGFWCDSQIFLQRESRTWKIYEIWDGWLLAIAAHKSTSAPTFLFQWHQKHFYSISCQLEKRLHPCLGLFGISLQQKALPFHCATKPVLFMVCMQHFLTRLMCLHVSVWCVCTSVTQLWISVCLYSKEGTSPCTAVLLLHFLLTGLIRKWWQPMIVKTPVSEWQLSFGSASFSTSLPPRFFFLSHLFPSSGLGLTQSEGKKRVV